MLTRTPSFFSSIPLAPPNSILGVAQQCRNDAYANKIDLTIGAYRDDQGKPHVLHVIREAEEIIYNSKMDHEYLPQDGLAEFNSAAAKLLFGENAPILNNGCVYTIQGLSGTGCLRLGIDFLAEFFPKDTQIFYPEVTWPNHPTICEAARMSHHSYRYLDASGTSLDFAAMIADIRACPVASVLILHMCAHNPTGVDPSNAQWQEILSVVKDRNLFVLFDSAYQGFVSGDPEEDCMPVRLFVEAGVEMMVACSFAKNFGLYGERVGALHVVTSTKDPIPSIASQLRVVARSLYSTCPLQGARIVSLVLNDPARKMRWLAECKSMADRLNTVRRALYDSLVELKVKGTWEHVIQQRGMFSYTGIPASAVAVLKERYHIYLLDNGRISLAGLNSSNTRAFAAALADVLGTNA